MVETAAQGLAHIAPVRTGREIFSHIDVGREKSFHIGAVSAVVAALVAALGAVAESKVGGVAGGVAGGVVAVVTVVGAEAGYRVGGLVALVAELGAVLAAGIASEVEDAFVVGRWLLQTGAAVPAVPVR